MASVLFIILIFSSTSIPQYYYSMENPGITFITNILLWGILSAVLLEVGLNLLQKSKDITKFDLKRGEMSTIFIIIGFSIIIIIILYIILLISNLIPTIQYFPHQWLSEDALQIDISCLINVLLIYLMLNVSYRVASKLINRGLKLKETNNTTKNDDNKVKTNK